jgi:acetylglutamate kinase
MKYAMQARAEGVSSTAGEILYEAMPWIKQVTGKTIVIKYGGSAMENPELAAEVMADIVLLKIIGINPVLVHGGGKAINRVFDRFNIPVEFVDGQRVTTEEAMDLVRMVLTGEVNQQLVEAMNAHGNMGVGVSGTDAGIIVAEQASERLGRVGKITRINTPLIEDLVADDYIPVIASIAIGEDGGCYNVNADIAAGYIAAAIGAHKIIFLTDVDGLYENYPDPASLIAEMSLGEAEAMIRGDKLASGMIPKLTSCVRALESGVAGAHIINGKVPHALLLELLTDSGMGTMVTGLASSQCLNLSPVGKFAAKLIENR